MLRRAARPLFFAGVVVIVFGLGRIHSSQQSYNLTNSFRFAWEITYAALLLIASYGVGLPDLPRTRRQALTSAAAAPAAAALAISMVQLVTGDALLPRFVVFGSAVLLNHLTAEQAASTDSKSKPLTELVIATGANVVVLDRSALVEPSILAQVAALHENGIRVRPLSLFYEEWLGKLPLSELERASLLFDIREVHGARYLRVKRLIDLAASLVGTVVLIAVMPFVLLGNAIANRGPLLYRQERVGKSGHLFTILKFRTMREQNGERSDWTKADDPRVTRFGRFMRRTHIDELPQVVNLLRGDLSIVGPRPEQPRYVGELVEKLPFYDMRHLVRPGVTGWAQVKYGYAGDEHDALEKLQYEFWYLRNQGLLLDTRIMGRTVRSVIGTEGRGR